MTKILLYITSLLINSINIVTCVIFVGFSITLNILDIYRAAGSKNLP